MVSSGLDDPWVPLVHPRPGEKTTVVVTTIFLILRREKLRRLVVSDSMAAGDMVVLDEHRTCDSQRTIPCGHCPLTIAGTMRNDALTENYDHQRVTFENATIFPLRL